MTRLASQPADPGSKPHNITDDLSGGVRPIANFNLTNFGRRKEMREGLSITRNSCTPNPGFRMAGNFTQA